MYLRYALLFLLCFPGIGLAELDSSRIQMLQEQAREQGAAMKLPDNVHREEGVRAAEESNARFRSEEFQKKISAGQTCLQQSLGQGGGDEGADKVLGENEQLHLFLSSSVPENTIRNYLADLAATREITLVMRGMLGGLRDRGKMALWYSQVTKKDPTCQDSMEAICDRYGAQIRIEPSLFTEYGIEAVPALVYARGDELLLIQGDAGLAALLGRINREAHSPGLEQLIQTLQKQ